ncbi:hypothetical protein, conserved [Eimeria praecox]|uniref:Polycystin cation channel PKD1/PKD2 domain-containing protein n=1 Tax=Eimeria praecox TaxID=51316 RepID=U6H676_9EIME|nr:hypothetical protein, conserved [Eimeria praecox]
MAQEEDVRFQGGLEKMLNQLTPQQQWEREGNLAAASAIRELKRFGETANTAEQKKALIDVGYKAKQKHYEKRLLLKDPNQIGLGNVLDGQNPLLRRDIFRRKLFPIRFEESAKNVEEVQQLLMKRQPVSQLVISLLYLAMLLLFLSYALEIKKLFEATDGIASPLNSALAPRLSSFNSMSYEVAKAEETNSPPASVGVTVDAGLPVDVYTLKTKGGVAAWLLYGFIPLLYGPSSQTSNLGSARVVGNCFRLTFRQVELEDVGGFDLGYDGIWPIAASGPASAIAAAKLRSDNPLISPPGSRFTYSYPFAASGEDKAFNQRGGHYQVICEDSMQAAQNALQQNQAASRYPPWFVPLPVIADRRTISTVVDFFAVNPVTETFSHCAVLFSFTSSGTLQRPLVWVSSLIPFSAQSDGVVRYTSLGLMLAFMLLYLLCDFLSSFAAAQVVALLAPEIGTAIGADGYYTLLEAPRAVSESEFSQMIGNYYSLFRMNDAVQQACTVFGSLAALTGLTTSAAFLLGGTLGNYNLYMMTSVNPVLAGIFFVPLFLVFSAFGFTIVTAVVLRKHDFCAESVQQGVIKYKLEEKTVALLDDSDTFGLDDDIEEARELKEKKMAKRRPKPLGKKKGKDFYRRELHEDEGRSSEEEDGGLPPQYPPWVWNAIGMEDPRNKYALQTGEKQGFYVDPASLGAYSRTYGYFSGFNVAGVTDRSNWYFTPDIPCTHVAECPAPSVAKVYVLVRNQAQEDHEDAWKKLFVVAFVAIIIATASLQLSVGSAADLRDMSGKAISKTVFPLDPVEFTCKDPSLGLPDVGAKIIFPNQNVFSVNSPKSLYNWLLGEDGLMSLLASAPTALAYEAFPRITIPSGATYQQLVVYNWNSAIVARSVRVVLALRFESEYPAQLGFTCEALQCDYQPPFEPTAFRSFVSELVHQDVLRDLGAELAFFAVLVNPNSDNVVLELSIRFRRDRGGTVAPALTVEAYELQPYAAWHSDAVAAIALQVASVALFLFFGCSFFVELYRLRRSLKQEREDYSFGLCLGIFFVDDLFSLKQEREDYSFGLCLGIFFVDDLFNLFDFIGFGVLAGSIVVWALHVLAPTQFQVFNLADDLATATAAAAAGGTQEAQATAAAGDLFEAVSSTAASLRAYAQLAAAILAVAFLRLLRIGRKRKRLTLMFFALASAAEEMIQVLMGTILVFIGFSLLASAAEEMIQVLMGTILVFIGFSFLCFLSFGRQLESYSTLKNSFTSTIMLTTGFFPLSQLFHADAVIAGAFVFPYLFFMGVICFSFFLCVLLRSLAFRSAEIKTMEKLGKIAHRSVLESLQLFFAELMCNFGSKKAALQQEKQQELESLEQHEDAITHIGRATVTKQQDKTAQLINTEERRRREKPLKVVELPPDVVTSALSDEQYAALPEEVRLYAAQEVALFIDRFRMMVTQLRLGSGSMVSLLQQMESETYAELSALSRDVAQQEGHLRHELSVYASQVVNGQQRLTAYIKYIEKALKDREEELQLQRRELEILESRVEGGLKETEGYEGYR